MLKDKSQPPRLPDRFLQWFCADEVLETLQGDLYELYEKRREKRGKLLADIMYWADVASACRPFAIKRNRIRSYSNNTVMLRHYFKISWRSLLKNKGYSFINIGGLAVGMAVAMLISLWIYDELSFNHYHEKHDQVGRVMRNITRDGETYTTRYLPYVLGDELRNNYGGYFRNILVAWPIEEYILSANDKNLSKKGEFIESMAPEMLSLKMLKGNRDGLEELNSILLSQSTAESFFGEINPIGKLVKINNKMDAYVTGVYEDLPHNSEFGEVKFFSSLNLYISANDWIRKQGWDNNFVHIYAEIKNNSDFDLVTSSIKDAQLQNTASEELRGFNPQLFLQPMNDWHLYPEFKNGIPNGSRLQVVWLTSMVAGFVLLLACINFMNLSTARSERRGKEVAILKTLGSGRRNVAMQFLFESFLSSSVAFVLAIVLVTLFLTPFNELSDKAMRIPWGNVFFWAACLIFVAFTSIVAGGYPAFYLSSFQPIRAFKGSLQTGRLTTLPRELLVVLQFSISLTLIISSIVVYNQIHFAKDRPVGYVRNGLLMIEKKSDDFYGKNEVLRNELKATGVVAEVSESEGKVTQVWSFNDGFHWRGKDPDFKEGFGVLGITPEYGKTIGWQVVAGRDFSRDFSSDSSGFIINEAAARYMGLENPVGELVRWERKGKTFRILGVVRDMVMTSPYEPPVPTIFFQGGYPNYVNIKINPEVSVGYAISRIEAVFDNVIPSAPFEYTFADQEYERKFKEEERTGKLASVFATLAIFISSLGMFGLASFVAEQRTKEIGIRKVLGASIVSLWKLMSGDFVRLVIISCVIAMSLAYLLMNSWLENYEYRTSIHWYVFVLSGVGVLMLTLCTVSYQAIKAATANPVNSLRSE